MIFVSVGTHHLPFNRLLKMINSLITSKDINEQVIIQSGTSKINIKGAIIIDYFSFKNFIKHLKSARIVICHAGPATIFQSIIFANKKPIVIPRLKKYGEHVGNHQLYFANKLENEKKIIVVKNRTELKKALFEYKKQKPTWKENNELVTKLGHYLSNIV